MLRRLVLCAALAFAAGSALAQTDEAGTLEERLEQVYETMDADATFVGQYAQCPADIHATQRSLWRFIVPDESLSDAVCEEATMSCYERCTQSAAGGACFSLARVIQRRGGEDGSPYHQQLFARSCANGFAAGCTNRGAGIRNGDHRGDPFADLERGTVEACLYRSFKVACEGDDPWGCTMHGRSYQSGEGVAQDGEQAARHFRRACNLSPNGEACRNARVGLDDLGVANSD
ncbi:hypothetical protein GTW25_14760 [Aliihoeflea aestuarii]|uniref:hypothetical protein n=1 Tax=Aliihoeflea aestuarii TaxID=453840 RepID=UPI0020963C41|nr:hypothetical protein [Aliihoeflea aestuarii]MCO6392291.1 hypothetical protein [Aliihoeflea aestuarii]